MRIFARALLLPADASGRSDEDQRTPGGGASLHSNREIEQIAVGVAVRYETEVRGAQVQSVESDNVGFDLVSVKGVQRRRIEVKGRAGVGSVELTWSEFATAIELGDGYWLYVVLDCAGAATAPVPRPEPGQGPRGRLGVQPRCALPGGPTASHRRIRGPAMTIKRLIEETLPLRAINDASDTDKRTHDGHISTMHAWWARRPLPMARALAAASLIDNGDDAAEAEKRIAQAMATKGLPSNQGIKWLRERISATAPGGPKVLDCFAGGGAIPLEALRLGCDTTAMDLNPVAVPDRVGVPRLPAAVPGQRHKGPQRPRRRRATMGRLDGGANTPNR